MANQVGVVPRSVVLVAVIGLGLSGCASPADQGAPRPRDTAGDATGATTIATPRATPDRSNAVVDQPGGAVDGDVLAGVEGCELLEDLDPDLHASLEAAVAESSVEHGPLVVVEQDGARAVATTLYEEPGVEGATAVWEVVDGDPVAITEEAADLSSLPFEPTDPAGETAVAGAVALAQDCSWVAADAVDVDPPPPEPTNGADLLVVEPNPAAPGDELALTFPEETFRGIAFQLDRRDGEDWVTTHWMSSDGNGTQYQETVPVDTEGHAVIDVGVGGPGPDHVLLPDDIDPGDYRVCTANAGDDFCAELEIPG